MSNACKLIPDAPNGKPSQLFRDLQGHLHDREMAKRAWAFTQTDLFKSEFSDITKDENGEPTYEALAAAIGLNSVIRDSQQDVNKAIDMGLIDNSGRSRAFKFASTALAKAKEFNEKSKHKVAVATENENGEAIVNIESATPRSVMEADLNEARRKLNITLLDLVERLGFNVEFSEDETYTAVFNPYHSEQTADNIRTIIRIANNEESLEKFPEEVAHLIISGLKDHSLKQRIDSVFTDDVVSQVLGEKYEDYRKEYSKKNSKMPVAERLREEAEAQVLHDMLTGGHRFDDIEAKARRSINTAKPLLQRLWEFAKSLFRKTSVEEIDNAFLNAKNAIRPLSGMALDGTVERIIDREAIKRHEPMYALAEKTEKLADIAQQGETILSKKLYILQHTQSSEDTKALRKQIELVRQRLMEEKYSASCLLSLAHIGNDIRGIMKDIDSMGYLFSSTNDLNTISAESQLVNRISTAVQAYEPFLQTLRKLPYLRKRGEIDIDEAQAERLASMANDFLNNLNNLKSDVGELRFSVLTQLVTLYYGDMGNKPDSFIETEKMKWQSVDTILRQAKEDINWWDGNLFSAGDSKNPLLNVIHHIITSQQAKRNNRINLLCAKMQEAETKLQKAGYENKFIYQLDDNGKPTGYFVAPVDFARYEKERKAFIDALDEEEMDYYEIQDAINTWERNHTEPVEVGEPIGPKGERRIELMPKKSIYENKDFQKGWSEEQKAYYNAVLNMKADMDSYLPSALRNLYLAPQVRKSVSQMFDKDGRGAMRTVLGEWKRKYSVVDDNMDYMKGIPVIDPITGEEMKDAGGNKAVLSDFSGKPIKRVPIYYTHRLENQADLSTDGTHAMFNYIAMTVNYSEMGQLAQAMRLMQDHVSEEFKVTQKDAGKPIVDMFRAMGQDYQREYTKKGVESRLGKAINTYIDRMIFNETKEEMGNFKVTIPFFGEKEISKDKLFNLFMAITSKARMGFNILSGITNVSQGESQMICEAAAKRFFDVKDLAWMKKEYSVLLPEYMLNFNSIDRHDKMYLLINQFNSGEDFFRDMTDKDFNKSAFKRVMGRGNVYFMNTMGEHYLHTGGMLAILKHEKVRRVSEPDKIVSLYDVIKPVHDENGWHLELDDNIEFVDKNRAFLQNFGFEDKAVIDKDADRDQLFENLSIYINHINAGMHGGYSEAEKGNINQQALGRLLLQFRQWMFGMYNKMYADDYFDATTNTVQTGGYRLMWRWIVATTVDLKNMTIKEAMSKNALTADQKANVRVAEAQALTFVILAILCRLTAGWKDDDDRNLRLLAYSLKRLNLETGALVPWPPTFIKNVFTLVQSPAAGINTLETIATLLDMTNMFEEINSGRYKGWNRWTKALYTITPIYNIQKVIDMKDYNYMFNIFK